MNPGPRNQGPGNPCRETRELLPWYVNGTLDAERRKAVESHLASCEDCRAELEETRFALAVAVQHVSTEALVAYVAGDDPGMDPDLLETHLASCADCAEELALLRESHGALLADSVDAEDDEASGDGSDKGNVLPWRPPSADDDGRHDDRRHDDATNDDRAEDDRTATTWRRLAAVAALLAVMSGVATFNLYRESTRLAERVAELDGPKVNIALVDLYPDDFVLRGETSAEAPAEVPPTSEQVTLILNSRQAPSSGPFRIEVRDPAAGTVTVIDGLRTDGDGLLVLSLAADGLDGERILVLFDADSSATEPLEAYRVRR